MESNKLFLDITNRSARTHISEILLTAEFIPTLFTFLRDLEYLKAPKTIMKRLIPPFPKKLLIVGSPPHTLQQSFKLHFFGTNNGKALVQTSEFSFRWISVNPEDH
jgi:Protein of unknown function (DUF3723)